MVKKLSVLLVSAVIALVTFSVVPGIVLAAEPGGATVDGPHDQGTYSNSVGTADVLSGHVYLANLSTRQSTYRWAGLYGTVTGYIVLADSGGDELYNWTATAVLVYACTGSSIDWANLADASNTDVISVISWLGGDYSDNYNNTFSTTTENIGSVIKSSLTSDYAQPKPTTSGWKVYSLKDAATPADESDIIWAAKVIGGATAYDGSTADYELIVPEDGTTPGTDSTPTTYNLWVELK